MPEAVKEDKLFFDSCEFITFKEGDCRTVAMRGTIGDLNKEGWCQIYILYFYS